MRWKEKERCLSIREDRENEREIVEERERERDELREEKEMNGVVGPELLQNIPLNKGIKWGGLGKGAHHP